MAQGVVSRRSLADKHLASALVARGVTCDLTQPIRHGEGNSDAHLLSTIIGTSLSWPYRRGRLVLGTWQGIYFIELDGPRERKVTVYVARC